MWWPGNLFAIALILVPAIGHTGDWTVPHLMALLRSTAPTSVLFEEEKRFGMLDVPLEQSGTLEYRDPGYLRKQVREPAEQTFEIDGDRVRLVQPDQPVREMGLDEFPALRAFADGFRALLAGDPALLARHYRLTLAGTEEAWTLTLTPRDQRVGRFLKSVEFSGQGGRIGRLAIHESGGDTSIMRIRPLP